MLRGYHKFYRKYILFYIIDLFFVIYFSEVCKNTPRKYFMGTSLAMSCVRLETVKEKGERKSYMIRNKFQSVLLALQKVQTNILILLFIGSDFQMA